MFKSKLSRWVVTFGYRPDGMWNPFRSLFDKKFFFLLPATTVENHSMPVRMPGRSIVRLSIRLSRLGKHREYSCADLLRISLVWIQRHSGLYLFLRKYVSQVIMKTPASVLRLRAPRRVQTRTRWRRKQVQLRIRRAETLTSRRHREIRASGRPASVRIRR